jgi:hypothetical protein
MPKYKIPDDRESEILKRNGIAPESVAIVFSDDDSIRVLNYKTRDEIAIYRGDKQWS